jgi:hypothetical protein
MGNVAFGIVCLIMGLVCLIFNESVTRWHSQIQDLFFGYHFGERERKISRFFFILGGILFTLIGVLVLLHNLSLI